MKIIKINIYLFEIKKKKCSKIKLIKSNICRINSSLILLYIINVLKRIFYQALPL